MRILTVTMVLLLAIFQYPLWWAEGGWISVKKLEDRLYMQLQANQNDSNRNLRLAGEVLELKLTTNHVNSAIEEIARYELGMVKANEIYVQFISSASKKN